MKPPDVPTPPVVPGTWEHGDPGRFRCIHSGPPRIYENGGLRVIVAREPVGPKGKLIWHLSISRQNRHPSWDEIKAARYRLLPDDVTMAMLLPPSAEYVNVPEQDHVFHLWEVAN